MIRTRNNLSSTALVAVGARPNYFATNAHYEAIAHRIVAALGGGSRPFVLVTGDPPADAQALSAALGKVAGPRYAVIIVSCGPELKCAEIERTVSKLAQPQATSEAAAEAGYSAPASPLFVFDDFDSLSDRQIEDVCGGALLCGQIQRAAVLLAPLDFLARLERPALRSLKERIAAQFRFQEVGDDEAIAVLHDELLAQRDRRAEARGFRRGILIGLAAGGVSLAASIGVFILYPTAERVSEAPAGTGRSSPVNENVSMLQPPEGAATGAPPTQAAPNSATRSATITVPSPPSAPSPTKAEDPPPLPVPPLEHPPAGPRLSATEVTTLLARGDVFLGTGDITSARLFYEHVYERAAAAESGLAAFRLGATFDPVSASQSNARATVDPAQALLWYRRARQLGVGVAEQRIERLDPGSMGDSDRRAR